MSWSGATRSWGILVAAIGIAVGGCSSSDDPEPQPTPVPTGTVQQAAQPSCAAQDQRCASVYPGSQSELCHQGESGHTLIRSCASSDTPATSESWACCKNR